MMSKKRIDELFTLCEYLDECRKVARLYDDLFVDIQKAMNNVVVKMRGVVDGDSTTEDLMKLIIADTTYGNGELISRCYPILESLQLEKSVQIKKCA
ncbi:hypothetical protein [Bartonella australis]|uniref:hypothetical protein n=1 Tax=Bartonella australis TaxID=388640 RepID=UPI000344D983|nr:hypothetical protein [Bartonella australis]